MYDEAQDTVLTETAPHSAAQALLARVTLPDEVEDWLDEFASWWGKQDKSLWEALLLHDHIFLTQVDWVSGVCVMQSYAFWQDAVLRPSLAVVEQGGPGLPDAFRHRVLIANANDGAFTTFGGSPRLDVIAVRKRLLAILGLQDDQL